METFEIKRDLPSEILAYDVVTKHPFVFIAGDLKTSRLFCQFSNYLTPEEFELLVQGLKIYSKIITSQRSGCMNIIFDLENARIFKDDQVASLVDLLRHLGAVHNLQNFVTVASFYNVVDYQLKKAIGLHPNQMFFNTHRVATISEAIRHLDELAEKSDVKPPTKSAGSD